MLRTYEAHQLSYVLNFRFELLCLKKVQKLLHIPWQMGLRTKCLVVRVVDINMETHKSSHPFMKRNPYFYGLLLGKPQAMWGLYACSFFGNEVKLAVKLYFFVVPPRNLNGARQCAVQ